MSSWDAVFAWLFVLVITIGIFLAALRARAWWKDHIRNDPLDPDVIIGYSLRREK